MARFPSSLCLQPLGGLGGPGSAGPLFGEGEEGRPLCGAEKAAASEVMLRKAGEAAPPPAVSSGREGGRASGLLPCLALEDAAGSFSVTLPQPREGAPTSQHGGRLILSQQTQAHTRGSSLGTFQGPPPSSVRDPRACRALLSSAQHRHALPPAMTDSLCPQSWETSAQEPLSSPNLHAAHP